MHSISKFLKKLPLALTLPPAYISALTVILDKKAAITGRGTSALKAAPSKPPCALHHSSHGHRTIKFHLTNRYTGAEPWTWTSLTFGDTCLQSGLNPFLSTPTSDNLRACSQTWLMHLMAWLVVQGADHSQFLLPHVGFVSHIKESESGFRNLTYGTWSEKL